VTDLRDGIAAILPRTPFTRRLTRLVPRRAPRRPNRFGLAATALLFAATAGYGVVAGGHLGEITGTVSRAANALGVALGTGVKAVRITGQRNSDIELVADTLMIDDRTSLPFYDAVGARERLEALPWIEHASIRKLYPGNIEVKLTERTAYALWQHDEVTSVIDPEGEVIVELDHPGFTWLPIVVGKGANERAHILIDRLGAFPELRSRLRAAVLIAMRRWNLILDHGVEVRLPEDGIDVALATLDRVNREGGLLSRDIRGVDLRMPDRLVVQLTAEGMAKRAAWLKEREKKARKGGNA